jgi:hypothetical protein
MQLIHSQVQQLVGQMVQMLNTNTLAHTTLKLIQHSSQSVLVLVLSTSNQS